MIFCRKVKFLRGSGQGNTEEEEKEGRETKINTKTTFPYGIKDDHFEIELLTLHG